MNTTSSILKCKKCGFHFEPDMATRKTWDCPRCGGQNPNLKRHYRSVADLYILGLILTLAGLLVVVSQAGLTLGAILLSAHALLLLTTIVIVYRSATPWTDHLAKTMIWLVLGVAIVFKLLLPLALTGEVSIPAVVVYGVIILPYFLWLGAQAAKCTATLPPVPVSYQ